MSRIFLALLLATAWLDTHAQSPLPPCPGDYKTTTWTNCFGTFTIDFGKYVGEFRDGVINGQGTLTSANGLKYVGEIRDGKAHGQGTNTGANGRKRDGEFRDWRNDKYVGEFRGSKYHGQGTYTWANGRKYIGEWRDDKRNGQGIAYAANGTIKLAGVWANNAFSKAYAIDTSRFPFSASSGVEVKDPPIREPNKKTSVGIVNDCLAKELKPGTSQFSECVAGQ